MVSSKLTVIIPTAGGSALLLRTLQSLDACPKPASYAGTVVVENGDPQGAAAAVAAAPASLGVRYVHIPRANKSNALNEVLADFEDETLVYLVDDDLRFAPQTLEVFATAAAGLTGGVVFGGPLRIDCDEPPEAWLEDFLPGSMKGWEPTSAEIDLQRVHFFGANWAVFAGDIRRAGGFDVRFGPGSALNATGQEWNMQDRLRLSGARFEYLPEAVVWHHVEAGRYGAEFVRSRAYRTGLQGGVWRATLHGQSGFPRVRAWGALGRAALKVVVCSGVICCQSVLGGPRVRLEWQTKRARARGFLKGYRATRRAGAEPCRSVGAGSWQPTNGRAHKGETVE